MKKICCGIALFLLVFVTLTGCGKNKETSLKQNVEKNGNDSMIGDKGKVEEVFSIEPNCALYHADSLDGHSIFYNDDNDRYFCVDSKGKVTFEIPKDEIPITKLCNGIFMTEEEEIIRIRNYKGEEIKAEGNVTYWIFSDVWDDEIYTMFSDGYILALRITESYASSKYEYGFIRPDGSWSVSLSDNNNFASICNKIRGRGSDPLEYINYAGAGVLYIYFSDDKEYYYDINTDKIGTAEREVWFTDGVGYDSVEYCYNTFSLHAFLPNGKIIKLYDYFSQTLSDPMFFYDAKNEYGVGITCYYDDDNCHYIADTNENAIAKIEGRISYSNRISQDRMQVLFENESGSYYYSVIDAKGNLMFDPVLLDQITEDRISWGAICIIDTHGNAFEVGYPINYGDGNQYCVVYVVNDSGEILLAKFDENEEDVIVAGINNGVLRIRDEYSKLN